MSIFKIIKEADGCYFVKGDLTFLTVNKKNSKFVELTESEKEICIDLEGIKSADSAGLALIIEWIKYCKVHRIKLTFRHVPDQILKLSQLGGFDISQYTTDRINCAQV